MLYLDPIYLETHMAGFIVLLLFIADLIETKYFNENKLQCHNKQTSSTCTKIRSSIVTTTLKKLQLK